MAMVGVDSGSLYRRTHNLSRLAWSWVGGHLATFYIHQTNRVNSRNGSAMMTAPYTLHSVAKTAPLACLRLTFRRPTESAWCFVFVSLNISLSDRVRHACKFGAAKNWSRCPTEAANWGFGERRKLYPAGFGAELQPLAIFLCILHRHSAWMGFFMDS